MYSFRFAVVICLMDHFQDCEASSLRQSLVGQMRAASAIATTHWGSSTSASSTPSTGLCLLQSCPCIGTFVLFILHLAPREVKVQAFIFLLFLIIQILELFHVLFFNLPFFFWFFFFCLECSRWRFIKDVYFRLLPLMLQIKATQNQKLQKMLILMKGASLGNHMKAVMRENLFVEG